MGSYHFGNPGLDRNNVRADNVLTPKRQLEIDRVLRALMKFKPTRVMVEMQSEATDLSLAEFARGSEATDLSLAEFARGSAETDALHADERIQLGFRLARLANLPTVYGIDEQPKAGEPDNFPMDKVVAVAKRTGQGAMLERGNSKLAAWSAEFTSSQQNKSVAQLLIEINRPGSPPTTLESYYSLLPVGDNDDQPGTELNANYYLRNAKIFAKLMHVAKPDDRVLVVYGAGHAYWLRHFIRETPGYQLVDAMPYLDEASRATGSP